MGEAGDMDSRPTHDPLSEEMDLITWQEAAARLYDESLVLESQIATLVAGPSNDATRAEVTALTTRLDAMRRVAERLRSQRPADSVDRSPSPPVQ